MPDPLNVMAGHSRPKDGVASLAYVPAIHPLHVMPGLVPGIHACLRAKQGVDGRDKPGHDEL